MIWKRFFMGITTKAIIGSLLLLVLAPALPAVEPPTVPAPAPPAVAGGAGGGVPGIQIISDPLEPLNRGFHGFNNAFSYFFLTPLEHGYTFIMPEPARKSVKKAGYNLLYVDRLVNNLLQLKFKGAGVETGRFLVNSTVGVLGFFDPATRMGMKNYNADFGQTLAHYGAGWGFYFEMPIFGPSSFRDTITGELDSLLNPASYVLADNFFDFNDLSFTLPLLTRIDTMELDPYATDRDLWGLERKRKIEDMDGEANKKGARPEEYNPVPTLDAVFLRPEDSKFPDRQKEHSVLIPATGKKLPYSTWMQKKPAPLIYIVQGVGVHRLADSVTAIAEAAWKRGYSAVTVSNPMSWEFIESAGTHALPGYTPGDAADFYAALTAIDRDLARRYPGRITRRGLIGLSLGGMQVLFISDMIAHGGARGVPLDRIVAINPPVDLIYAMKQADAYYNAALAWPAAERPQRMMATLIKASRLVQSKYQAGVRHPFSAGESEFLIGYLYRLVLRSILYSSQKKQNLGVLKEPLGNWRRDTTYDRLMQYSYQDYLEQFLLPYYQAAQRRTGVTQEEFIRRAQLRAIEPDLRTNAQVRVFANSDDFLVAPADLDWLRSTMDGRITVFPDGGHLGNLHLAAVQDQVFAALADLR